MSPEERQLLQGLFDRMHSQGGGQRDAEAEQMIADGVRQQPYAPYLLAQTVLVQDQALQAANAKLQDLEAQVRSQGPAQSGSGGGFLSGLFGGGSPPPPPVPAQRPVWNQGGAMPQGGGYPQQSYPQQGYPQPSYPQQGGYPPPPAQAGPWGGGGMMGGGGGMMGGGGGGFLHGALQTAAGVAGGVMLADGIKSLFGGHNNPMGIASGLPGMGGETVVNNYYDESSGQGDSKDLMSQNADAFDNSGTNAVDPNWQPDTNLGLDASDFGSDDDGTYDT